MTKRMTLLPALLCGLLMLVAFTPGCGTNAQTRIAQAERLIITAVNDGMSEWRDYVNAGKATKAQIAEVRTAYQAYYAAQLGVKTICLKLAAKDPSATPDAANLANFAMQDTETALLKILNGFLRS